MSLVNPLDTLLENIKNSLAAKLPARVVTRSLPLDPVNEPEATLRAGLLCVLSDSGGRFANYRGREGQLGHLLVPVLGFVRVDDDAGGLAVERAELALLDDVLGWCANPGAVSPVQTAPQEFRQSHQLEQPYGWFVLTLDVRT